MIHALHNSQQSDQRAGMTLVEMMFGLVIGSVVLGIATTFLVSATRATLYSQSASQNDLTEWGIFQGITVDTRTANGMTLYKTFSNPSDFSDATKQLGTFFPSTTIVTRGDFMVLSQSEQVANSQTYQYTSLTGYIFTPGATSGTGIFQKFTYQVLTADQSKTLEAILTAHKSDFKLVTVASGLNATHSDNATVGAANRAFFYRSVPLRSGVLNLEATTGFKTAGTYNAKLIETAFNIRN